MFILQLLVALFAALQPFVGLEVFSSALDATLSGNYTPMTKLSSSVLFYIFQSNVFIYICVFLGCLRFIKDVTFPQEFVKVRKYRNVKINC